MRVLVFAPHNDDEILGAGGTVAKLCRQGHEVYICVMTVTDDKALAEKIKAEAERARKLLGVKESIYLDLPVVRLKTIEPAEINGRILDTVKKIQPEVVFIPHKGDMHTDHYETALCSMVALRPVSEKSIKKIYAYETLSETEWNIPSVDNAFIPNVWVDISDTIELKLDAMACFESQVKDFPHPRSLKAIRSLSEYRGSTVCVNNAESFMLIRSIE